MGTNTQTAEPRVEVAPHIVEPCSELPEGFYAVRLTNIGQQGKFVDRADSLIVDAQKLPNLIHDLQAALLEVNAQALLHKAPQMSAAEGDAFLAELEAETPDKLVTLERPAFSSEMTALIAASGNYRAIWDILSDPESPTWGELTDEELVSIVRDYWPHRPNKQIHRSKPLEAFSHEALMDAAKFIFVPNYVLGTHGGGACALTADPAVGGDA